MLHFGLSPRAPVNHLMAPVVGHLIPPANFIQRLKTPDAQLGLAIESTHINARGLDCDDAGNSP
jgi:hypothetical protein